MCRTLIEVAGFNLVESLVVVVVVEEDDDLDLESFDAAGFLASFFGAIFFCFDGCWFGR